MGQKITFRVFNIQTGEDVTDQFDWYIDRYGDLYFETNDVDTPLALGDEYRYEVTFINNQP